MIKSPNDAECLLRISDGLPQGGFVEVEGLRVSGWQVVSEEVDITSSADDGWRRLLSGAGLRSLEVHFTGLYLGSPGQLRLRELAFEGRAFEGEVTLDNGKAVRGRFIASELRHESVVNEEATCAAVLRSVGPILVV